MVIANAEARDLVVERFRTARGELLDVLQAESDWFEAGAAYLAGLADRDMAHYELMEFTGDLARFFAQWENYPLVLDKWFALQASLASPHAFPISSTGAS